MIFVNSNLFPASGFPDARGSDLQSLGSTRHSPWSRLELGGLDDDATEATDFYNSTMTEFQTTPL